MTQYHRFCAAVLLLVLALRTAHGANVPAAPAPPAVFFDDFSAYRKAVPIGEYPEGLVDQVAEQAASHWDAADQVAGWEVIRGSSHAHLHRQVQAGSYWITREGNEHCPIAPSLKNFILEFDARPRSPTKVGVLYVDFRLSPDARQGYRILYRWGKKNALRDSLPEKFRPYVPKTIRLALLDYPHRANLEPISIKKFPEFGSPPGADPVIIEVPPEGIRDEEDTTAWQKFRVEVQGNAVNFFHNGRLQAVLRDTRNRCAEAGRIGFDTIGPWGQFAGSLEIAKVRISTTDPIETKALFDRSIEFPYRLNAIHGGPLRYNVRIGKSGDVFQVAATLGGGPAADQGPKSSLKHALVNPYIRIEDVQSRRAWPILLFAGKIGDTYPERVGPLGMNDHMGPVERTTYVREFPERWRLAVGYDYFHVSNRDHQSGGPNEIMVDPNSGKTVYFGPLLESGFNLRVESPPEKKLLEPISPTNKQLPGFKTFMSQNHFFTSGEPLRFRGDLWLTNRADLPDPSIKLEVLDAFHQPLGEQHSAVPKPDPAAEAAGLTPLGMELRSTGFIDLRPREPGVYHLRATLMAKEVPRATVTKAFEVLPPPGSPKSPAELCGLPDIDHRFYVTEDAWQVDSYHYVSVAPALDADGLEIARALSRHAVVHDPGLPYWIYIPRVQDPAKCVEILARIKEWGATWKALSQLYYWTANVYATPGTQQLVRDYTNDSACPADFKAPLVARLGKNDSNGTQVLFTELREHHWRSWIDYLNRRIGENIKELRTKMREIAPDWQIYSYGHPMPCGNDYIGMDFCRTGGQDYIADNIPFDRCRLEAYFTDHRHSIDRSMVTMALLKMVCPRITLVEDNEGETVCLEDNQNARAWAPYGVTWLRPGFQKKATLLQMLATMYFDGKRFQRAWDDCYGPGSYIPERWRETVEACGIFRKLSPLDRPVPTVALAWSWEAIRAYDFVWDDLERPYNPADETLVFAGEEIPRAGVPGGYVCRLNDIGKLSACDTLVLPPLKGVATELIQAIRKKYEEGVNLVGFQDAPGLEDLFGVELSTEPAAIASLVPANNPFAKSLTDDLMERRVYYRGQCGQARYRLKGAIPILEARDQTDQVVGPALVVKKGSKASTAFWTVPPTDVWREHIAAGNCATESLSELVKRGTGRVVREISRAPVTVSAGQVLAFWGTDQKLHVLCYENAYPEAAGAIRPIVTIRQPGAKAARVECSQSFETLARSSSSLTLATVLEPEGVCRFTVSFGK